MSSNNLTRSNSSSSSGGGGTGSDAAALNNPHAQKAKELFTQADKLTGKWVYLKGNKWEDALDLFQQAANKYKMAKCYHEAGDAFTRAVQCHFKLDSRYEAATCYVDAANCYRKSSMPDAVKCMQQAIHIYTENGKFPMAAKLEKELGEMLEEEGELDQAISHLQTAADYFDTEGQKSSANTCTVKIAHLLATQEHYEEAQDKFEQAAANALDDRLLKWGAKEFLFKALVCCMAKMGENVEERISEVQEMHERCNDLDVHFPDSYESKLIGNAIKAIEKKDVREFTTALRDYDNISKLDNWKTTIFLRVKNNFEQSLSAMPDIT